VSLLAQYAWVRLHGYQVSIAGLTSLGTIVAVLISLKDKPLSNWPIGLTFVTVLSKIASAALILPISEAIGQLKWSWFHGTNSQDAFDFEIFDKASRGAWGSFLLLCRTKGRSLAALGALLTVLLLAIDTFFQQVTDLPTRWTLYGSSSAPQVIRYEPHYVKEFMNGDEATQPDQAFMTIADAFFTSNGTKPVVLGNGTRPEIPLSCPTSNCTWPVLQTLGMCSQCMEAPQLITYACLDTRIDWTSKLNSTASSYPNATACGYFLNATSTEPVLMSGYILGEDGNPEGEALLMRTVPLTTNPKRDTLWGGSINFKDVRNPIVDALISTTVDITQVHANMKPTIHECIVTWCVKTIESSSYWEGTYRETVTNTFVNRTAQGSPWSTFWYDDGSIEFTYLENVTISPPPIGLESSKLAWGLSDTTMINAIVIFDRFFPAFMTAAEDSKRPLLRWRLGHPTEVRTKLLDTNPWLAPNNITQHLDGLTTALTNAVRSNSASSISVRGNAFARETYVAVRWTWLSFPLAMLGLSVIFLAATIVKTSKGADHDFGMWKTSAMPTLVYSLPQTARQDLTAPSTRKARKVKIRLVPGQGWRVSGQMYRSSTLSHRDSARAPPGWL
jgi:hypothetical protein